MAQATGTIRVQVTDTAGRPLEGAAVYYVSGPVALPDIAAQADESGRVILSAPAGGTYVIGCNAAGFQAAQESVEVEAGGAADVSMQLTAE
jgi:hypothetical protein